MGNLAVDYGQASVVSRNISSALTYLEEEIAKINAAISEIESLNRGYGKTSTILNELYDQKKKAQTTYDEMKQFSEKFNGFIKNVKTTDSEMAKKFTADVKTYCKKNNIEITSEFDAFLDKVQVVLDVVGVIPVFGDVADALNAVISLCRGNYLEALICLVAILPMGDLLKGLKFADKAKDILKLGDKALTATKTVAKEGAEKLSKQMTKLVKSGKIDNVIATMDAGKDFVVKFKNGSTALIKKGDLSEFVCQVFEKGCFMAGTLVITKEGLKPIEEVKIGEYVMSRNEESGETSYKKVTDTLIRSTYNICTIELENGKIKSTTGHLFMVQDKWWKAAAELKAGDILETADEQCQIVKSITVEEKGYPVTTYNLSVEDNHTFFVNNEGILTHNMSIFKDCEIRAYRQIDSKALGKYEADKRLVVDMPFVGKGNSKANAEGWLRDAQYYWSEVIQKHPDAFSSFNKSIIEGKHPTLSTPVNDKTFRSYFPQYDEKGLKGTQLIHHHIAGGGQAVAIPKPLHPGFGGVHNKEKYLGIWGSDSKYAELLEKFLK